MLKKDNIEPKNIVSNVEKKNNICSQNKGITLVALVITIIRVLKSNCVNSKKTKF